MRQIKPRLFSPKVAAIASIAETCRRLDSNFRKHLTDVLPQVGDWPIQPVMEALHAWMKEQIEGKKIEPNSELGEAIQYMLNHWEPLTLFLRLIHTCRLNGVNPFEYLTILQSHAAAVKATPADWLPWNYPQTVAALHPD